MVLGSVIGLSPPSGLFGLVSRKAVLRKEAAMDIDDLEPKTPKKAVKNLEPMAIAELEDYIETLRAEIARAEAQIKAKKNQQKGAASLFKF
jgi:uncharacterized small protein (DUF1192 family)